MVGADKGTSRAIITRYTTYKVFLTNFNERGSNFNGRLASENEEWPQDKGSHWPDASMSEILDNWSLYIGYRMHMLSLGHIKI